MKKRKTPRPIKSAPTGAEAAARGRVDTDNKSLSEKLRKSFSDYGVRWGDGEYKRTGNPLYAWNALMHALAGGLPIPDATRGYFQRAARVLGNDKENPRGERDVAEFVKRALELSPKKGGPSYFQKRLTRKKNRQVLLRAEALSTNLPGRAPDAKPYKDALEQAAEDAGTTPEAVLAYVKRMKGR